MPCCIFTRFSIDDDDDNSAQIHFLGKSGKIQLLSVFPLCTNIFPRFIFTRFFEQWKCNTKSTWFNTEIDHFRLSLLRFRKFEIDIFCTTFITNFYHTCIWFATVVNGGDKKKLTPACSFLSSWILKVLNIFPNIFYYKLVFAD